MPAAGKVGSVDNMAGTIEGGKKAAAKNLAKNPDFYREIGRIGGMLGKTGGFASDKVGADGLTGRQRASVAGVKGGHISRRGHPRHLGDRILEIQEKTGKTIEEIEDKDL